MWSDEEKFDGWSINYHGEMGNQHMGNLDTHMRILLIRWLLRTWCLWECVLHFSDTAWSQI